MAGDGTNRPTTVVLICTGLIYLEASNVFVTSTILPYVARDMADARAYVLPTTVFLLASLIGIRLFISVSDGRSLPHLLRVLLAGFLAATVLCALAPSFHVFVLGRGAQGMCGGALSSLAYLAINQYFTTDQERMRYMAWMSFMWSVSCITGPLLGGLFVEYGSWRMAVGVNVLWIAVLAAWTTRLKETHVKQSEVTLPGIHTGLLIVSIIAAMAGSTQSGQIAYPLLMTAIGAAVLFGLGEATSPRPFISTFMFQRWSALHTTVSMLGIAALVSSTGLYITLLAKELHQASPVIGGLVFSVEAVGWGGFGLISARLGVRHRTSALFAGNLVLVGCTLIMALRMGSLSLWQLAMCNFGVGMGIGIAWPHITNLAVSAHGDAGHKAAAYIPALQIIGSIYGASLMSLVFNVVVHETGAGYAMAQSAFTFSFALSLVLLSSTVAWYIMEKPPVALSERLTGSG